MSSKKDKFSKEIEIENFSILLRFNWGGGILGSFILHDKKEDAVFEITDGLFISIDQKISFAFSIEWNKYENGSVSTVFSGYFENRNENMYFIDWLTVYESSDKKMRYTKKGEFSSDSIELNKKNRPYPGENFDFLTFKLST